MKYFVMLLLIFVFGVAGVQAQKNPKAKAKRAFSHTSESSEGKTNKARFRHESKGFNIIDLHPKSPARFKTAKANKNYKFSNGRALKPVK